MTIGIFSRSSLLVQLKVARRVMDSGIAIILARVFSPYLLLLADVLNVYPLRPCLLVLLGSWSPTVGGFVSPPHYLCHVRAPRSHLLWEQLGLRLALREGPSSC